MTDDYADDWQDLTEKELLVGILTELQQLRLILSQADSGASDDGDGEDAYRCQRCGESVPADARGRHARESHRAPPGMVEGMFEVVE
jgi:hypothetical protein